MKLSFPNIFFIADRFRTNPFVTTVEIAYLILGITYIPILLITFWNKSYTLFIQLNVLFAIVSLLFFINRYLFYQKVSLELRGIFSLLMFSFLYTAIVILGINTQSLIMLSKEVIIFFSGLILLPFLFVYLGLYRLLITKFSEYLYKFLIIFLVLFLVVFIVDLLIGKTDRLGWVLFAYVMLIFLFYSYKYDRFYKNYFINFIFSLFLFTLASLTQDFNYFILGVIPFLFDLCLVTKIVCNKIFKSDFRFIRIKSLIFQILSTYKLLLTGTGLAFILNILVIYLFVSSSVFKDLVVYFANQIQIINEITNFKTLLLGYGITKYQYSEFSILTHIFLVGGVLSVILFLYWVFSAVSTKQKLLVQIFQIFILFTLSVIKIHYLYSFAFIFLYSLIIYVKQDASSKNGFSNYEKSVTVSHVLQKTKVLISLTLVVFFVYLFYAIDAFLIRV